MSAENEAISSLREALKVSPNNVPLREHLAQTLLSFGRAEDAEQEYRQALGLSPENAKLKTGLARAFAQQGKNSQALAVLESLIKSTDCPPTAHLLYARLIFKSGDLDLARRHYQKAVSADPGLAEPQLAAQLGAGSISHEEILNIAVPIAAQGQPDEPTTLDSDVERPKVTFKDVGGMETVKDEIRMKIIHPLVHPELYAAYGKKVGGGILMYGPPGCGKTHLARATAGEIKAAFLSVGINDVLDMWIGSSEKNLHELFEQGRRNQPCVLFFDEVDALAASRADMRHHGGRHLINQFLSEMDGISANNDGLLILAATNAPWHVDSAFRRPGRFDRILFVPPPDASARAAILRILTTGKPVSDIDYDLIAKKTDAFSGADLKAVVDVAVEAKLKQAMKAGGGIQPLTTKDLASAAGSVKPSTRDWFASARNYALYSNQGGAYDDILKYLKLS
ncbi:MAG: AAA family ATPase [Tepidisphaeraceae bacterium]|jgi:ATP-dependent 26S proteasome regulatory subunit